ncbi:MAG TPA: protein-glutamate O-methyltransferase [Devosiaceae bacterium]|jgi:chemotaxis protein methyltransferase CheR
MEQGEFPLSEREFKRIQARVYAVAGISLSEAKRTLVVSRLSKTVRTLGLTSFDDYVDYLEHQGSAADGQNFVNALTTNLTRFFREDHHFAHLSSHVRELIARRPRVGPDGKPRLRIWSAGCSTGQEPYTIALSLLSEFPELRRWDFRILATDIDTNVVAKAATGLYPDNELSGLTPARAALFEKAGAGMIGIPAAARELVSFKQLNLIADGWPMRGPFDAVFCRNVAIYFDKPTQGRVFARLGAMLAPEGFLYIGHSENLGTGAEGFRLVGKTIYQIKSGPKRAAA